MFFCSWQTSSEITLAKETLAKENKNERTSDCNHNGLLTDCNIRPLLCHIFFFFYPPNRCPWEPTFEIWEKKGVIAQITSKSLNNQEINHGKCKTNVHLLFAFILSYSICAFTQNIHVFFFSVAPVKSKKCSLSISRIQI